MSFSDIKSRWGGIVLKDIERTLREYRVIETRIDILQEQLKNIDDVGISALDYTVDRVQTSNMSKPVEDVVLKKVEIEKEIYLARHKLDIINKALSALDEEERQVIQMQVIEGKQWYKLCSCLHLGETALREKKKRALRKIRTVLQ